MAQHVAAASRHVHVGGGLRPHQELTEAAFAAPLEVPPLYAASTVGLVAAIAAVSSFSKWGVPRPVAASQPVVAA